MTELRQNCDDVPSVRRVTMQLTSLALSPPVSAPDRTLSETPDSVIPPSSPVIVLVDPVSTGACLAKELADRGHRCVMAGCSHTHTERMRACVLASLTPNVVSCASM